MFPLLLPDLSLLRATESENFSVLTFYFYDVSNLHYCNHTVRHIKIYGKTLKNGYMS
jgi:hypothetical protein